MAPLRLCSHAFPCIMCYTHTTVSMLAFVFLENLVTQLFSFNSNFQYIKSSETRRCLMLISDVFTILLFQREMKMKLFTIFFLNGSSPDFSIATTCQHRQQFHSLRLTHAVSMPSHPSPFLARQQQ